MAWGGKDGELGGTEAPAAPSKESRAAPMPRAAGNLNNGGERTRSPYLPIMARATCTTASTVIPSFS